MLRGGPEFSTDASKTWRICLTTKRQKRPFGGLVPSNSFQVENAARSRVGQSPRRPGIGITTCFPRKDLRGYASRSPSVSCRAMTHGGEINPDQMARSAGQTGKRQISRRAAPRCGERRKREGGKGKGPNAASSGVARSGMSGGFTV